MIILGCFGGTTILGNPHIHLQNEIKPKNVGKYTKSHGAVAWEMLPLWLVNLSPPQNLPPPQK